MARPRQFDEQAVLDAILSTFWAKGYEATSIDDLVKATGLVRASLYGCFGDKEALFKLALDHYIAKRVLQLGSLPYGKTAKEKLQILLRSWIDMTCPEEGPKGCFLSFSGTADDTPEFTRHIHKASVEELKGLVAQIIQDGQNDGSIRNNRDPKVLAMFCIVTLQGVASLAKAEFDKELLVSAINETLGYVIKSL